MKVVIAGGAGMIGSHLVDAHLANGDSVVALDNLVTGRLSNLALARANPNFSVVQADLSDPHFDATEVEADLIYHLASPASPVQYAKRPIETLLVNSAGTYRLLELAEERGARFVLASTSEVYGDPLVYPQTEEYWGNVNPIGPRSCYDEGKRFSESITMAFHQERGVDVRIGRIFNTYGPRSDPGDGRLIPNFVTQALSGRPLTVYGSGYQSRSFCFISDLIGGLVALASSDVANGAVVNLGSTDERTVAQVAAAVIDSTHSASTISYRPLPVDDPVRRVPAIERAERLLGWRPETTFEEGLRRTVDYFRSEMSTDREPESSLVGGQG